MHARHGEILQLLNTLKKVTREVRQCERITPAPPQVMGAAPARAVPAMQEASQPDVAHALAVRAALAAADYPRFFQLYPSAPRLGRALMDVVVPKLRFDALQTACKAIKPTAPLPFLAKLCGFGPAPSAANRGAGRTGEAGELVGLEASQELAGLIGSMGRTGGTAATTTGNAEEPLPGCMDAVFEGDYAAQVACQRLCHAAAPTQRCRASRKGKPSITCPSSSRWHVQVDSAAACLECIQWLQECGAAVLNAHLPLEATLDCKASAGQLTMPSLAPKVAHDDENLTVDDFLKGVAAS